MTLTQERNRKIELKTMCSRIVKEIKALNDKKSFEIAEVLKIEPETLSRGESEQVLAALQLLLELEQTKKKLAAFEAARNVLIGTAPAAPVSYGAATPSHYSVNDTEKEWREVYQRFANQGLPVTALQIKDGAALQFENWDAGSDYIKAELLGTKWLKHLLPGARTRLLAWLNNPDQPIIKYRGRIPNTDKTVTVTLKKQVFGKVAVCTGMEAGKH